VSPTAAAPDVRSAWDLPALVGVERDLEAMRTLIADWLAECDPEIQAMAQRQLSSRAKSFRPVTVFACYHATTPRALSLRVLRAAAAVELIHNVSLIVDDILDRSRYRRGELSLHCRYGFLPGLMTAGYIGFAAPRMVASDAYSVRLIAELMQRLGAAECFQWRVRRQPMGVEDWRAIAAADTGSMFEICARLGTRDDRLQRYGLLLGMLYHGCDDVADVRGTTALGGGSEKDIVDGILTLPAAIAVRDPVTATLFRAGDRADIGRIAARLQEALPEAEAYLDRLADEATAEATEHADDPGPLVDLVRHTRSLSRI
jgi:geranylgeranyl pyrophosphate synthase